MGVSPPIVQCCVTVGVVATRGEGPSQMRKEENETAKPGSWRVILIDVVLCVLQSVMPESSLWVTYGDWDVCVRLTPVPTFVFREVSSTNWMRRKERSLWDTCSTGTCTQF
jgi:hypothetical protein